MASAIKYDAIHAILVHVRQSCRDSYDVGRDGEETVHFACDGNGRVFRCDEDHREALVCTVTWQQNNKDLRDLAREIAGDLDLLQDLMDQ